MQLQDRIHAMVALGTYLRSGDERIEAHVHRASVDNPWFTKSHIHYAIGQIASHMLNAQALTQWTAGINEPHTVQSVGIIMAGNIPMVGFHDLLCVFLSGHRAVIKLSDRDRYLIPFLIKILNEHDARTSTYFEIVDTLAGFDAVIATGSNNSARYFEYYFAQYPHIIRKNRNAVAILNGSEHEAALDGLCDDIFLYFGQGCRSVAHCFVPPGYDFTAFINRSQRYAQFAEHHKYRNNLDYHAAIHILNRTPHFMLPHLILVENPTLISPVGCLYYSYVEDRKKLYADLQSRAEEIQCVVMDGEIPCLRCVPFGKAQQPGPDDYADGIDTLAFLQTLGQ